MVDANYTKQTAEDLVRLQRRIARSGIPGKVTDSNLIIGTWNLRAFGAIFHNWDENPGSPKRNLRALLYISQIIRCFDVIAVQEVKSDTSGVRCLLDEFLGPSWGIITSDVSGGEKGNSERLTFLYDKRRVQTSGLAGEIVLPPTSQGSPAEQFDRTPYIVGFQTARERFALLTAHIRYGKNPADRIGEISALAKEIATDLRNRASGGGDGRNLIVLGDFNIDDRGENPLFKAFVSTGLTVPKELLNIKTTYDTKPKYYDQIAWFMDGMDIPATGRAGSIDFTGAVLKELDMVQMSYRISDHLPLWVEFSLDRSTEKIAAALGIDPGMPDPFASIPD